MSLVRHRPVRVRPSEDELADKWCSSIRFGREDQSNLAPALGSSVVYAGSASGFESHLSLILTTDEPELEMRLKLSLISFEMRLELKIRNETRFGSSVVTPGPGPRPEIKSTGASIYDVRKVFGLFDPLPLVCLWN